jgi:hypothetical protein
MISLASSFQRRQPRFVSITLALINHRRTFTSNKFRRTSGEHFRRNRALPVQMGTTLEFPSLSSTPWCGGLLDYDVGCVIFPNSGDSSATPTSSSVVVVHLWPKVSTPSHSSLSIPFHFAIQSTVSWSFPSNPLCLLFLCLYTSSRRPPSAAAGRGRLLRPRRR